LTIAAAAAIQESTLRNPPGAPLPEPLTDPGRFAGLKSTQPTGHGNR
jgi:hypothetical protein